MRKNIILLAAGAVLVSSTAALALQASDPFQARVTIQAACLVAAGDLDFGTVGPIVGTETASAAVNVNCSVGTPFTLSFASVGSSTSYSSTMVNGAEDVAYSAALSGSSGSGVAAFTIGGTLPVQVTPTPGLYTENRTLYVNF